MLVFACISPHPPIILPDIGSKSDREKVKSTIISLESLAPKLTQAKPDIIIISSPHPDWGIDVPLHFLLTQIQNSEWRIANYQQANSKFIIHNSKFTVSPVLTTLDSPKQHYLWGQKITTQFPEKLRVAWIASGDMSHVLKEDGPYGFHPSGPKFDREFIERLKKKDIQGILNMDQKLIEKAGVCGLWSFCMLLGALEESHTNWQPEILSYEGPFGVGYLVANIKMY
ncbi:MAG: AmmeMemoRadiSam system protein B [Candidatus Gottesmanbacteria bacterium]